jgi:hypothetical protein
MKGFEVKFPTSFVAGSTDHTKVKKTYGHNQQPRNSVVRVVHGDATIRMRPFGDNAG